MPEAEASAPEKQILKQDVHERALKKHKNFLRRQRAKQAKQQQKKEQEEIEANKTETSSDSGVSTKSEKKQQFLSVPKEKYTTRNIPERSLNQPKQPQGFKNNFQNQGKLRASSDNDSLNGERKVGGQVFIAKPVKQADSRSWANSRLRRQRSRIGSRS
jgi:hypothetical protein